MHWMFSFCLLLEILNVYRTWLQEQWCVRISGICLWLNLLRKTGKERYFHFIFPPLRADCDHFSCFSEIFFSSVMKPSSWYCLCTAKSPTGITVLKLVLYNFCIHLIAEVQYFALTEIVLTEIKCVGVDDESCSILHA